MKAKKQNVVEYIYEQTEIHFLINPENENVMVNATEMGKIFGKEPKDFLRAKKVKEFIEESVRRKNIVADSSKIIDISAENIKNNGLIEADSPRYKLEEVYYSNNKGGTFMNRHLALKFAAWLDVKFEAWIFDTIDKILFQHYNIHRKKVIEIEKTKAKIEELKNKIIKSQDKDAIDLLKQQENLKELQKDKSKAIIDQTKIIQLELFKNEKNDK